MIPGEVYVCKGMSMDNAKLLITEREACQRLSIGRGTLRKLWASGAIEPVRIGRAIRFRVVDLEPLIDYLVSNTNSLNGGW